MRMLDVVRSGLDHELVRIREDVLRMGSLVESCVLWTLGDGNESPRGYVMEACRRAWTLRERVDRTGLVTLATQHPTARDLRRVIAAMHIALQLVHITRHCSAIVDLTSTSPLHHRLRAHLASMLHGSMDAYVRSDIALAIDVAKRDAVLDEARTAIVDGLFATESTDRVVEACMRIYWTEHHVERIGDCVVNICDRVVFDVTGNATTRAMLSSGKNMERGAA